MKTILLLFSILPLLLVGCNRQQDVKSNAARYNVQTFTVMGVAMICQITDNEQNKTYVYEMKDQHMELKTVIDLSKTGDQTIPLAAIKVEEKVELKRSEISPQKDILLGTKPAITLRMVQSAQKTYLSMNPTEPVSSLTAEKVIPHLSGNLRSLPTVRALDGSNLKIKVSVMPPVFIGKSGAIYDPSGDSSDGLWDVGN